MTGTTSAARETPAGGRARAESSVARSSALVLAGTVAVGVANYGFSLALAWVLVRHDFAVVASANSLLVVVGTAGSAAVPWLVAQQVAKHAVGSEPRRTAISFAFGASLLLGALTTVVVLAVAATYAGPGVLVGLGVTTVCLFVGSTGVGLLQGTGRFGLLAALGGAEVILKVGLGTALAAGGFGPAGAVAGAAAGAAVIAGTGLALVRGELGRLVPHLRVVPELWRGTAGIGAVQVAVSVLTTLDVVVGSVVDGPTRGFGGYQAMVVLARVPLFASTAVSYVVFPRLAGGGDKDKAMRQAARLYLVPCVLTAAVVASLPAGLVELVLPHGYAGSLPLLLPLALAGFGAGTVNLFTTFLQADGWYGPTVRILLCSTAALAVVEVAVASPVTHLAWAAGAGDLAVGAWVVVTTARRVPGAGLLRPAATSAGALVAACAAFIAARAVPGVWLALAALAGGAVVVWWWGAIGPRTGNHWAGSKL